MVHVRANELRGHKITVAPGPVDTIREPSRPGTHNQRWLDYTGLSAKQALDSGWEVAIHPDDLPRILETYREALNSVKPFEVEGRFHRFDGEFRWFLFGGSPLRDQSAPTIIRAGTEEAHSQRRFRSDRNARV